MPRGLCKIALLIVLCAFFPAGNSYSSDPSVAFFYAANPPVDELKAFDIVIADPDGCMSPATYGMGKSELFAYVSLGETGPARSYAKKLKDAWIVGRNKEWGSVVMDPGNPDWRRFFVDEVIAPLWNSGYRGFFLDTLDSYRLSADKERYPRMEEGIVAIIRDIKKRFPEARLILNRGFEVLDRLRGDIYAVAAESLFSGYNPARGGYCDVDENDRGWLLERLNHAKSLGLPVISIDYVRPGMRQKARQTAAKISGLGFIPWVTDKDLSSLGVGSIEVAPRKVLGLYDGREAEDPTYANILRFATTPLNYLGYILELRDMRRPLPDMILEGRYAGLVVWPNSEKSAGPGFGKWLEKIIREGVKVVFLDYFGIPFKELPATMGIETSSAPSGGPPIRVVDRSDMMDWEAPLLPNADYFPPIGLKEGRPLVTLADSRGNTSHAAGITPWGGYVLAPLAMTPDFMDNTCWETDPFRFFREALRLPDMPVPDVTTENGARLLLSHVDGDGFESRAEWPGGGYASQELRKRILEKYRLPTTVSVITGVLSPNGLYPGKSAEFEKYAREIFSLPWVEAASHSFSHPFKWRKLENDDKAAGHNLHVPGYRFSLDAEIGGSIDYINSRLLPPGKKVRVFQWTGDCVPGPDAIAATYRAGVGNINGGETVISESHRSLAGVAPLGVGKDGWFQVYAPNQNENIYTKLWSDEFYGYRRVLETFRLTDTPRRLKPVNIYYHFYSATKTASLAALDKVCAWAAAERLNAVFASEYIDKVLDFNRTVLARKGDGWLVRNGGSLREMRIPASLGYPEITESGNVAGFNAHNADRYIHLGPGGEAEIRLAPEKGKAPYISRVNGALKQLSRDARGLSFAIAGRTAMELRLANAERCSLSEGKQVLSPAATANGENSFHFPEGEHELKLDCRQE